MDIERLEQAWLSLLGAFQKLVQVDSAVRFVDATARVALPHAHHLFEFVFEADAAVRVANYVGAKAPDSTVLAPDQLVLAM